MPQPPASSRSTSTRRCDQELRGRARGRRRAAPISAASAARRRRAVGRPRRRCAPRRWQRLRDEHPARRCAFLDAFAARPARRRDRPRRHVHRRLLARRAAPRSRRRGSCSTRWAGARSASRFPAALGAAPRPAPDGQRLAATAASCSPAASSRPSRRRPPAHDRHRRRRRLRHAALRPGKRASRRSASTSRTPGLRRARRGVRHPLCPRPDFGKDFAAALNAETAEPRRGRRGDGAAADDEPALVAGALVTPAGTTGRRRSSPRPSAPSGASRRSPSSSTASA